MKKIRVFGLILFIVGIVTLVILFLIGFFRPKGAGLLIQTTPEALVYIDNEEVGKTPYEITRQPGEISLKLKPQTDSNLVGFETKLNLISGIQTIVRREFASDDSKASGEIISFEKTGGKEASMAIVTEPDAAQIAVDGLARGFSPYKIGSITPGDHQITLSAPGFIQKTLSLKTQIGHKLILIVKLAIGEAVQPSPTPTPQPVDITMVKILPTPNDFLRVRAEASAEASELFRVKSGESFPLIEESTPSGWFKIEYETGKYGWVSSDYAQIEEIKEASPSPTPLLN